MKKTAALLLLACPAFMLCTGCGDDDDNNNSGGGTSAALKLESSVPADGGTNIATSTSNIVLNFDAAVGLGDNYSKLTFNDAAIGVSAISLSGKSVTVALPVALQRGNTYALSVPQGAFKNTASGLANEAFTVSFSTQPVPQSVISTSLCTPSPMAQTKNLYNFLVNNYGKNIISSAIANVNWNFDGINLVKDATGKTPAMVTMDYIHLHTPTTQNPYWTVHYEDITEIQSWCANNGIMSACWHWNVPYSEQYVGTDSVTCTPGTGVNRTTVFRPNDALTEGTWQNTQMTADLEKISSRLKLLQDAGIPVIWRPLHEAAGNTYTQYKSGAWFWWGADGAEAYVKLWRYMFDFFKSKGINNLIWVWTSQMSNADDSDYAFYPGDEYVDIVSCDIYPPQAGQTVSDATCAARFNLLSENFPNKMITLSEFGSLDKISAQWQAGAKWSYFMPWYTHDITDLDQSEHADKAWWLDAAECENVLWIEDIPNFNTTIEIE